MANRDISVGVAIAVGILGICGWGYAFVVMVVSVLKADFPWWALWASVPSCMVGTGLILLACRMEEELRDD